MPEEFAAQGAEIKRAVDQAIRESEENGMSKKGKEVTPWLLARVVELTGGKSLQNSMNFFWLVHYHDHSDERNADLALLENTAVIG